ncbi:coiled-coil domain-containing protein 43 [Caerostris darwini]|uniref:Coiled-coil domain-containing protein 43 n=1 Tax=Caerostris darwini TaxID=1538125 RepID=A0AAV4S161_9ARAC|nr:coiled-coil domain-containing protein 43 [Caerostris darwini]
MAVQADEDVFNEWLTRKLETFQIEDEVLSSYISSIITTDDADTDKVDNLKDMFENLVQNVDIDALCTEILEKWSNCSGNKQNTPEKEPKFDLGHKVSLIMEKSVQPILKSANRSVEQEEIREAILSRCTFVSSEEEDYDSDEGGATASGPSLPAVQNHNVEAVAQAERDRRQKLKSESEQKKVADKVNREKQKQKQDERREKERKRTQKQERRR